MPPLPWTAHKRQGWPWGGPWLDMGMQRGVVPRSVALGGQLRRRIPDSDCAAQLPLPRTIASPEGAWLDQVQEFNQPLHLSWFHLKQDLVSFNFADSQQLWEAQVLGVNLEYPAPQGASPEGEETALWEDALGRGGSLAGVFLKQ